MILRVILAVVVVAYLGYGLAAFGLELYTSPRYVRRPPRTGLWGPIRFLSRDTWTEEGLRRRNRMLLWQVGALVLTIVVATLW